jgi:hypothetical protein
LNKTLSECKPLPQYNAQASVYSVYQDSSHETPIPVNSDGHFDNNVLTGAADSTVKLEVALGEDNYAEVETIASSDSINSSDATNAELKSCPEKIFAFPGEIVIFKVYSEPGINLKSAGLKFSLKNNPSIGCITQPLYLCIFGAHKYQVAYGCLYVENGLNTPVDTTITATTNSGLTLNIFIEVIKKTSSLSGTVYTGGIPMVKGFVRSLGPKACSKLDASGAYSLPKVFQGHYRKVVATWWTEENGKKVRHREEKIIDFFNSDTVGFNFGVPPTPTPLPTATPTFTPSATPTLRPPEDPFYRNQVVKVIGQYEQWENEFGKEQATQMTLDWLNGKVSAPSAPEGIAQGGIDYVAGTAIGVEFTDGMYQTFGTSIHSENNVNNKIPKKLHVTKNKIVLKEGKNNYKENSFSNITASEITTFKPNKILILSPFDWDIPVPGISLETIAQDLEDKGYDVTVRVTHSSDLKLTVNPCSIIPPVVGQPYPVPKYECTLNSNGSMENIVSPWDFEHMGGYGLIYILGHGWGESVAGNDITANDSGIIMGPYLLDDEKSFDWVKSHWYPQAFEPTRNKGEWNFHWQFIDNLKVHLPGEENIEEESGYIFTIALRTKFFERLVNNYDFKDTVIFNATCESAGALDQYGYDRDGLNVVFSNAKFYLGFYRLLNLNVGKGLGYYFFRYLMYGNEEPVGVPYYDSSKVSGTPPTEPKHPMHVKEAFDALDYYKVTQVVNNNKYTNELKIFPDTSSEKVYFPAPVTITVHKNK